MSPAAVSQQSFGSKVGRWFGRNAIRIYAALAFTYLFIPVAYTLVFSFNNSGRSNYSWQGFTLDKWKNPCGAPDVCPALATSLKVGILATAIATVLGTMIAFALARHRFHGRTTTNLTIFLPMATPEVVMGASLLTLFVATVLPPLRGTAPALYPTGFLTILIAHVMFNISYVVVTVKARLAGFDRRLEEAAMDLGANEWTTFWRVTFPLILPGILAAALLAFSLSIDDFVITSFVSGTTNTFPILVYSIQKNALPVQINVIGSVIFFAAVGVVAVTTLVQARRSR